MKRFTFLEFRFQKAVKAKSFGRESKLKWVHTALLVSALELSGSARLLTTVLLFSTRIQWRRDFAHSQNKSGFQKGHILLLTSIKKVERTFLKTIFYAEAYVNIVWTNDLQSINIVPIFPLLNIRRNVILPFFSRKNHNFSKTTHPSWIFCALQLGPIGIVTNLF